MVLGGANHDTVLGGATHVMVFGGAILIGVVNKDLTIQTICEVYHAVYMTEAYVSKVHMMHDLKVYSSSHTVLTYL